MTWPWPYNLPPPHRAPGCTPGPTESRGRSHLPTAPTGLPWVLAQGEERSPEMAPTGEVPGGQHGGEDGSLKHTEAEGKGVQGPEHRVPMPPSPACPLSPC